tara:strand:+ start:1267 stop:2118 length:852 start_codon:yes stop_codon:yes gene_type:complete
MGGGNSSESNNNELTSYYNADNTLVKNNLESSKKNLESTKKNLESSKKNLDDIKNISANSILLDAKLPQYRKDAVKFANDSYNYMDKRSILVDSSYTENESTNKICVRTVLNNNKFETYRVSCNLGEIIEQITDFPNLNCTNKPKGKMYINDNNIKSLYTHMAPYSDNDDTNITTNISVYHELKCTGDYDEHGGMNNLAKKLLKHEMNDGYYGYYTDGIKEGSEKVGWSFLYANNRLPYEYKFASGIIPPNNVAEPITGIVDKTSNTKDVQSVILNIAANKVQ